MSPYTRYRLEGRVPVPARVGEPLWAKPEDRIVASPSRGDVSVETVFLGVNHGFFSAKPILFETWVSGGKEDGNYWRYATWAEAEAGHRSVVDLVLRGGRKRTV